MKQQMSKCQAVEGRKCGCGCGWLTGGGKVRAVGGGGGWRGVTGGAAGGDGPPPPRPPAGSGTRHWLSTSPAHVHAHSRTSHTHTLAYTHTLHTHVHTTMHAYVTTTRPCTPYLLTDSTITSTSKSAPISERQAFFLFLICKKPI